jgi:hypothetical protein
VVGNKPLHNTCTCIQCTWASPLFTAHRRSSFQPLLARTRYSYAAHRRDPCQFKYKLRCAVMQLQCTAWRAPHAFPPAATVTQAHPAGGRTGCVAPALQRDSVTLLEKLLGPCCLSMSRRTAADLMARGWPQGTHACMHKQSTHSECMPGLQRSEK